MVVKPFVLSLTDATSLYKLQKKKNLIGQIEFHKRWDISNRYAKSEFLNGDLGDILRVDIQYSQNRDLPLNIFKNWWGKNKISSRARCRSNFCRRKSLISSICAL